MEKVAIVVAVQENLLRLWSHQIDVGNLRRERIELVVKLPVVPRLFVPARRRFAFDEISEVDNEVGLVFGNVLQ